MKLKRLDLKSGFRPYIALALIMLILYFSVSPFIKLAATGSVGGFPSPFSGQTGGRGASSGGFSGRAQGETSGAQASGGFSGRAQGTTSGAQASGGFSGRAQGTTSGAQASGGFNGRAQGTTSGAQASGEFRSDRQWTSGAQGGAGGFDRNASGFNSGSGSASSTSGSDVQARVIMIAGVITLLIFIAALYYKRRLTPKIAGAAIVAAGFVMRYGYMLYTPFSVRGHDVGNLNGNGHLAYIYSLYKNFSLPATNSGQFYHPPLNYIFEAITAHFYAFVTHSSDINTILEATRLVPCFASCALLIVLYKLFGELGFNNTAKLTALSIVAFHPTFFILSASINNDMLMIFFFMTAFLYTVRWYRNPTFKNIILIAVSSGLSMMTKFSGGLIVAISGVVFLVALIKGIRSKRFARLIGQFATYAAIFLPLGLWYSIRNLILFKQPIGYVLQLGLNSAMYTGNKSIFDRFLSFPPGDLFSSLYCNPMGDYRLLIYTVKCSLFGEFSFNSSLNILAAVLILLNIIMILLSLAAMIYILIRRRGASAIMRWGFSGLWVLMLASFIYFNIRYPLTCTMDFRYIVPTVISGAAFLGVANSQMRKLDGWLPRVLYYACTFFTIAFSLCSVIFYIL
jgi:hypothetical protein